MILTDILIFGGGALFYGALLPPRLRAWALLVASVIAIYWLQPVLTPRYLDFVLPTATLLLVLLVWRATQPQVTRADWVAFGVVALLVVLLAATRYLRADLRLTPSRPPDPVFVALSLFVAVGAGVGLWRVFGARLRVFTLLVVGLIILLFVLIKTAPFAAEFSRLWRAQTGQDVELATNLDLGWLGFSYVAFRLLHILFDWRLGRLPALPLRTYLTYAIFFPAYTAGPIDRVERHHKDEVALDHEQLLAPPRWVEGLTRILVGIFKKFVLADTLALVALSPATAVQAESAGALWLLLYAYALRLYLDFSGYSDIAIGLARLYGIALPENFDRPYFRSNIAAFWQSWHMTLSQWARTYVFSPVSRALLTHPARPSPLVTVFVAQLSTMLVIGLWHGVTGSFILWGLWHGFGLFIHKRWSDRTRPWYLSLKDRPLQRRLWTFVGWCITFHFVVLSWVFFALPDLDTALLVLRRLFGLGG